MDLISQLDLRETIDQTLWKINVIVIDEITIVEDWTFPPGKKNEKNEVIVAEIE